MAGLGATDVVGAASGGAEEWSAATAIPTPPPAARSTAVVRTTAAARQRHTVGWVVMVPTIRAANQGPMSPRLGMCEPREDGRRIPRRSPEDRVRFPPDEPVPTCDA